MEIQGHASASDRQMNCRRPCVLVHSSYYTRLTQTGGLINNRNVFLTVLEAGNSKIKAPADSVSGRRQRTAISSLCLHMVEASRERALWVGFFFYFLYKDVKLIHKGSILMT